MSAEAIDDFFRKWTEPDFLDNSILAIDEESYESLRNNFLSSNITNALMLTGSNMYEMALTVFVAGYLLANHVQRHGLSKVIDGE